MLKEPPLSAVRRGLYGLGSQPSVAGGSGAKSQGPRMWVGMGGRRQAPKTEDSHRCGDRCVGSTSGRGRLVAVPMASVGTRGEWRSRRSCWGGGEVFEQGSGPWITLLLAKVGCLPGPADRQPDRLPAFVRARLEDRKTKTRQGGDVQSLEGRRCPWELRAGAPSSARGLHCPAREPTRGKAGKRMVPPSEVQDKPSVSSGPPAFPGPLTPPMCPSGQQVQVRRLTPRHCSRPPLCCSARRSWGIQRHWCRSPPSSGVSWEGRQGQTLMTSERVRVSCLSREPTRLCSGLASLGCWPCWGPGRSCRWSQRG